MTEFTRLTVVGSARKAELVVPDDEAIGGLIPRLMELLEEPSGPVARPLVLVRSTGEQLDAAQSAAEQSLSDGEQLRLIRADDAPPPPEVADVTDVVGDTYPDRPGRWSTTAREAVAATTLGAITCVGLLAVPLPLSAVTVLVVAATAVAVLVGRLGHRWSAIALTAIAAGAAPSLAASLLALANIPSSPQAWLAIGGGLIWAVLGFGVGAGLGQRFAVPGSVVGAILALLPVALAAISFSPDQMLAVTAAVSSVICGLLPWFALSASGLTGLDDQVLAGRPSRRPHVLRTVDEAYRALSWTAVAVALPLGVSAALLVRSDRPWPLALGIVVTVLTALRTRAFPLTVQQVPLCLAAVAATIVGIVSRLPLLGATGVTVLLAGMGVIVAVAAGVRPADHQRARLRRIGNFVEAVLVIGLIPLVLGVFGVYADLLGTFR